MGQSCMLQESTRGSKSKSTLSHTAVVGMHPTHPSTIKSLPELGALYATLRGVQQLSSRIKSSSIATAQTRLVMCTKHMFLSLMCILIGMGTLAAASCECGYSSSIDGSASPSIFTDIIESDFLHIQNIALDTDWRRQEYNVTTEAGRGPYGMNFTIQNVVSNPILNESVWTGPGEFGPNPGVQLSVGGGIPANGYVQVAEMDSSREDLLWGTYRAAMQLTLEPGTCSAFFWVSLLLSSLRAEFGN
jgi:hypothetical protein